MSDNLIVDVSTINSTISKVRQLYTEASAGKYYIVQRGTSTGYWSSPLHLTSSFKDFRLEAIVMNSAATSWKNWNTPKITRTYKFRNDFTLMPVITATYDGNAIGVTVSIDATADGNTVVVTLLKPSNQKWDAKKDQGFFVHLIAVGH